MTTTASSRSSHYRQTKPLRDVGIRAVLGGNCASTAENPASTGETHPSTHLENMAENPSISDIVKVLEKRVRQELNDRLPRRVGVVAVNHFNQNFRDSGWRDNGLQPWLRVRAHVPYIIYYAYIVRSLIRYISSIRVPLPLIYFPTCIPPHSFSIPPPSLCS